MNAQEDEKNYAGGMDSITGLQWSLYGQQYRGGYHQLLFLTSSFPGLIVHAQVEVLRIIDPRASAIAYQILDYSKIRNKDLGKEKLLMRFHYRLPSWDLSLLGVALMAAGWPVSKINDRC